MIVRAGAGMSVADTALPLRKSISNSVIYLLGRPITVVGVLSFTAALLLTPRLLISIPHGRAAPPSKVANTRGSALYSGGASTIKESGHFEVRKSSSQVIRSQRRSQDFLWECIFFL